MSTKTVDKADEALDAAVAAIEIVATTLSESDPERDCLRDDLLGTVQAAMFREGEVPTVSRQVALNTLVDEYNAMTKLVMLLVDLIEDIQAGKGNMKFPALRLATADTLEKSSSAAEQARLRLTELPAGDGDDDGGDATTKGEGGPMTTEDNITIEPHEIVALRGVDNPPPANGQAKSPGGEAAAFLAIANCIGEQLPSIACEHWHEALVGVRKRLMSTAARSADRPAFGLVDGEA